jgi:hypothetical protein
VPKADNVMFVMWCGVCVRAPVSPVAPPAALGQAWFRQLRRPRLAAGKASPAKQAKTSDQVRAHLPSANEQPGGQGPRNRRGPSQTIRRQSTCTARDAMAPHACVVSALAPHNMLRAVRDSDPRLDAALEHTSFTLMRFKHHVVANLIGRKKVDGMLVAVVGNDVGPFARKKLQKGQNRSITRSGNSLMRHSRVTILGCSSSEDWATAPHNAALRS